MPKIVHISNAPQDPETRKEKWCRSCDQILPIEEFYPKRKDGRIYTFEPDCRSCYRGINASKYTGNAENLRGKALDNYRKDPKGWTERHLARRLFAQYGLTWDEYDAMYESQNSMCAICSKSFPNRGHDRLCVDHDHDTGEIRGLLCRTCNTGIGQLQDNVEILQNAISYLKARKNGGRCN